MSAHWWVKLGLVLLVGRAVARGAFRGSRGLKMTLGSLFVAGWGCVSHSVGCLA